MVLHTPKATHQPLRVHIRCAPRPSMKMNVICTIETEDTMTVDMTEINTVQSMIVGGDMKTMATILVGGEVAHAHREGHTTIMMMITTMIIAGVEATTIHTMIPDTAPPPRGTVAVATTT